MAPILIIDEIPKFISPEEHRTLIASTPASFSDIPPVLRHQEEDVSITLDPPLEGFSTEECSKGTLYVIESVLVYKAASGRGIQIEYPSITLHAISRAESGPSIYCQLDESAATPDANGDEGETTEMRELTIIPKEVAALELIFEALSVCAALHPDPADADDMDDDDDDAFIDADENSPFETFTGAEGEELSEVGRAALEHIESIIYDPFETQREQVDIALNGDLTIHEDNADASDNEHTNVTQN